MTERWTEGPTDGVPPSLKKSRLVGQDAEPDLDPATGDDPDSAPPGGGPGPLPTRSLSGAGEWLRRSVPWLRKGLVVLVVLILGTVNVRLYASVPGPATADDVRSHLAFLRGELDDGLGIAMQEQFPEGYFFSHVLYGLTWVEVGLRLPNGDPGRNQAIAEARWALDQLLTPAGRAPFSPDLEPAFGGFYVGWTNYLRAGVVALTPSPNQGDLLRLEEGCDTLVEALAQTDGPFLASYPGQTWPVDTFPAIVSIEMCGRMLNPVYHSVVDQWLIEMDGAVDPTTGLLPHQIAPVAVGPRATSQTMILRFLAELDPQRAAAAYARFRQDFVGSRFGLPAVAEYPADVEGVGDVDSGPLISGISLSASVVMVGAAQANGDRELARALRQQGEAFGLPLRLPGGRRYALGQLPLGDLFVVWASAAHPWLELQAPQPEVGVGALWRWPTHLLSLLLGGGVVALGWPGTRERAAALRRYSIERLSKPERRTG